MWVARRRLSEDLARWREFGWVTAEGEAGIRRDLIERRSGPGLAAVLAILGAVLLGFAIMSFVAANWQDMPRLVRLTIIFAGLVGAYGGAAALFSRGFEAFGHAAILLGVAIFGAGIMLIAQMYHIEGHPTRAILVWALGALFAGILIRSNPALAFATVLFAVWSTWETTLSVHAGWRDVHWPLLAAALVLAAAYALNRWWPGVHLTGVMLAGWLILQGYLTHGSSGHLVVAVIGLVVAVAAIYAAWRNRAAARADAMISDFAAAILGYGMIAAFAGLWALQFFERNETGELIVLAGLTLVLLVAAIHQGLALGFRGAVWLGYAGFSAEIFALYVKTVGSLLGSSLFFLVAGLIVIALAGLAWRLHRAEAAPEIGVVS